MAKAQAIQILKGRPGIAAYVRDFVGEENIDCDFR